MVLNKGSPPRLGTGALATAAFAIAAAAPRPAQAKGAFPDEFSIHFQPNAPSRTAALLVLLAFSLRRRRS